MCVCARACVRACVCVRVRACVCMFVCMCVCVHVFCVCICQERETRVCLLMITRAFVAALKKHAGQYRFSGLPSWFAHAHIKERQRTGSAIHASEHSAPGQTSPSSRVAGQRGTVCAPRTSILRAHLEWELPMMQAGVVPLRNWSRGVRCVVRGVERRGEEGYRPARWNFGLWNFLDQGKNLVFPTPGRACVVGAEYQPVYGL